MPPRYDPALFSRLLDEAMTAAGTSNRALAAQSGVHISNLGRWRRGTVRPAYDGLVLLATALTGALREAAADPAAGPSRAAAARGALGGVTGLFSAAGYAAPDPGSLAEVLPDLVAANRDDPAVMHVWRSGVPAEAALGMIRAYLGWRDSQQRQAGLPGLAAVRH
jgi:transcriptional regulator with XRE-family HTH domain